MNTGQWISAALLVGTIALAYMPQILWALRHMGTPDKIFDSLRHVIVLCAVIFAITQFVPRKEDQVPPPRPVAPVAKALASASSTDRAQVRGVYRALADVTRRDGGRLITSTSVWRAIHSDALRRAVGGTDLVGKYPGLDTAVEEVLATHFPLDNKPLDDALVAAIVAACQDVEKQSE